MGYASKGFLSDSRKAEEDNGRNERPTFASSFGATSESERNSVWWRRRELNPRPWQTNQPRLHA